METSVSALDKGAYYRELSRIFRRFKDSHRSHIENFTFKGKTVTGQALIAVLCNSFFETGGGLRTSGGHG